MAGQRLQFEEKEYETDCTRELALNYGAVAAVWSPGQKLEELVGFDVAAAPTSAAFLARTPTALGYGIQLTPSFWERLNVVPRERLPTQPFSLFLQYKRPKYHDSPLDALHSAWRAPYYRFTYRPPPEQRRTLVELERNVQPDATVLYAAPAFRTSFDLEQLRLRGEVLSKSNFHAPSRGVGHRAWTYAHPGGFGRPNEAGDPSEGPTISGTTEALIGRSLEAPRGEPVEINARHLRALATAVRRSLGDDFYPLREDATAGSFRDPRVAEAVSDLLFVARGLGYLGTTWVILQAVPQTDW
jgi:hypothetical protein